jgi:hypothetical protein
MTWTKPPDEPIRYRCDDEPNILLVHYADLSADRLADCHARPAELAPADLLAWLHREPAGSRIGSG